MRKKWFYIEKGISLLQIGFGIMILVVIINSIYQNAKYLNRTLGPEWIKLSILSYIEYMWLVFLASLLLILGGSLLLRSKRIGWLLSMSAWIFYVYKIFTFMFWRDITTTSFYEDTTEYLIISGFFLLMVIILILLSSKPLREKYTIDRNSWLVLSGIVFIFIFIKQII